MLFIRLNITSPKIIMKVRIMFIYKGFNMRRNLIKITVIILVIALTVTLTACAARNAEPAVRIGIIGAMDDEVATLKDAIDVTGTSTVADMEYCEGKLDGKNVVVVQCGMGKVNAGLCAQTLISEYNVDCIINTGVAGSLDNRLDIGDIVISTEAVEHDFDVSPIGFRKGEIPYTGQVAFPADEGLRQIALKTVEETAPEVQVLEGRVCTGDQFISTEEQKDNIIKQFGGLCCEMEGGAIAQVCYLNHIPYVIIRAISDKFDGSNEVDYEIFQEDAAKRCASIVRNMVANIE